MKKTLITLLACSILLCGCSKDEQESESITIAESSKSETVSSSVTTTSETEIMETTVPLIENPDIRNLKWGMSVDEVKKYETSDFFKEEVEESTYTGKIQTLITYRKVEFLDYSTKMILCVDDVEGLSGVNYYISSNNISETYNELCNYYSSEYGEPTSSYENFSSSWDISNLGQTIFINFDDSMVGVHFFPLSAEENNLSTKNSETNIPVEVSLANKTVQYKDVDNWIFSDYVLFEFKIINNSNKDIKGISGKSVFRDMFGKDILTVNCDLTEGVSANNSAIDSTLSLKVNQYIDEHNKLKNTPYEDIQFEYIVEKIVYNDGTTEEY